MLSAEILALFWFSDLPQSENYYLLIMIYLILIIILNCYLGGTFSTVNSQGVEPDYRVDAGPHKQKVVIFGYLQNNVCLKLSDGLSFLLFRCFRFFLAFLKLPVTSRA